MTDSASPLAHSLAGRPEAEWEPLAVHSAEVAELAAGFARRFGAEALARLAGSLHDLGKVSAAFQAYIRGAGPSPDHSTAGAIVADGLFDGPADRMFARLAAFAIAGHHASLADGPDLVRRLAGGAPEHRGWRDATPPLPSAIAPALRGGSTASVGYRLAFLGRMVFSCLVDADFLATERFYAEASGTPVERGGHAPLAALRDRLNGHLSRFDGATGALNDQRARILRHARAKAALPPGLFTMSVPTGGGKTLAGLAFALDHALAHGLDRVVYVIPYAGARIETLMLRSRCP